MSLYHADARAFQMPTATVTPANAKLEGLQILRFTAAFAVVLYHLFNNYYVDFGAERNYFPIGAGGVDVFFVLSGFVIAYSTRPEMGAVFFAQRRIARIVPLYWGLTLGVAAVALLAPSLLNSTRFDVANLLQSLFFIPYQKENGLVQPMLFLGWTLNYEMLFYAIFAAALALPRWSLWFPCALVSIFVVIGHVIPADQVVYGFYTNAIMLEFVFGIFLFMLWQAHRERMRRYLALYITLFIVIVFAVPAGYSSNELLRPFTHGIAAVALVAAALSVSVPKGALMSALLLLGDASYSLYLSHPFVMQAFSKLAKGQGVMLLAVFSLITLFLTIALSLILYRSVELPARRWLLSWCGDGIPAKSP